MSELLDWWTVRGDRWGVRNLDFKIELNKQERASRAALDDYSEADLYAYDGGNWSFVTMRLVPVDRSLVDMIGAEQLVSGIEWGELSDVWIDREDVTEDQAKAAAIEAVRALRIDHVYVDMEADSEFAKKTTAAPF